MDDLESGRGFESKIIASISTPLMVAQVLDLEVVPDRELVLHERMSTIALQRQVRQNFAAGRFEGEDSWRQYDDIGRLMFVPAMTPLRIKYEGREIRIVRCMFPQETFSGMFAPDSHLFIKKLRSCLNIKSSVIRNVMVKVATELNEIDNLSVDLIKSYSNIIIIELKRYFDLCIADGGVSRGGMRAGVLRKVVERIEADAPPPTLDELVAISGLSKRHLTRSFRQSTGQTILEKVNEARFSRAMLAISRKDKSMSEVAEMSGYNSVSAFSHAYKNWFGKSPTKNKYNRVWSWAMHRMRKLRPQI